MEADIDHPGDLDDNFAQLLLDSDAEGVRNKDFQVDPPIVRDQSGTKSDSDTSITLSGDNLWTTDD